MTWRETDSGAVLSPFCVFCDLLKGAFDGGGGCLSSPDFYYHEIRLLEKKFGFEYGIISISLCAAFCL